MSGFYAILLLLATNSSDRNEGEIQRSNEHEKHQSDPERGIRLIREAEAQPARDHSITRRLLTRGAAEDPTACVMLTGPSDRRNGKLCSGE